MTQIAELHDQAMAAAEAAFVAKRRGESQKAAELNREAYRLERKAAMSAVSVDAPEPTRSILLRGAGTLALWCGEYREAEKLAATALAGDPPPDVAEELRDLLEETDSSEHPSEELDLVLALTLRELRELASDFSEGPKWWRKIEAQLRGRKWRRLLQLMDSPSIELPAVIARHDRNRPQVSTAPPRRIKKGRREAAAELFLRMGR